MAWTDRSRGSRERSKLWLLVWSVGGHRHRCLSPRRNNSEGRATRNAFYATSIAHFYIRNPSHVVQVCRANVWGKQRQTFTLGNTFHQERQLVHVASQWTIKHLLASSWPPYEKEALCVQHPKPYRIWKEQWEEIPLLWVASSGHAIQALGMDKEYGQYCYCFCCFEWGHQTIEWQLIKDGACAWCNPGSEWQTMMDHLLTHHARTPKKPTKHSTDTASWNTWRSKYNWHDRMSCWTAAICHAMTCSWSAMFRLNGSKSPTLCRWITQCPLDCCKQWCTVHAGLGTKQISRDILLCREGMLWLERRSCVVLQQCGDACPWIYLMCKAAPGTVSPGPEIYA